MTGICGIDPGQNGGFAIISNAGIVVEPMPVSGKELNLSEITAWLRIRAESIGIAYLESAQAMPKQGVSSTFKFGRNFGALEGILSALQIPYQLVKPSVWCKEIHQGISGDNAKHKSLIAVSRLFPGMDLKKNDRCRVFHDGMIDALLIAEYGRRQRNA